MAMFAVTYQARARHPAWGKRFPTFTAPSIRGARACRSGPAVSLARRLWVGAILLACAKGGVANAAEWSAPGRCGANSLYSALRLLKHDVSWDELAEALPVDGRSGSSLDDLAKCAKSRGLNATVRRATPEELANIPTPFIMQLETDVGGARHCVTVTLVFQDSEENWRVRYIDGDTAALTLIDRNDLALRMTGDVLTLTDDRPPFATPGTQWLLAAAGLAVGALAVATIVLRRRRQ